MENDDKKSAARPMIRKLALFTSIVLLLLGAGLALFPPGGKVSWFAVLVTFFVGFVMLTIGRTGNWPAPKR